MSVLTESEVLFTLVTSDGEGSARIISEWRKII